MNTNMKKENNYAFIDSQNLNLSIQSLGWKLDFARFRVYLKEKYGVKKAFIFIGYIEKNKSLYTMLNDVGYTVVFKLVINNHPDGIKGNVDAELVLHTMIEYQNFDKAVVVSGDGDFACLIEYLDQKEKLGKLIVPNRRRYSKLLKVVLKDNSKFLFLDGFRKKLQDKQNTTNRS